MSAFRSSPFRGAENSGTWQYARHRPDMIEARLTAFERNTDLCAQGNFAARASVLDVIQQVYQLLHLHQRDAQWGRYHRVLRQQARALEMRLRRADEDFFQTLRGQIRRGEHTAATLRHLFEQHTRYRPGRAGQIHRGYDALDALVQGLMRAEQAPTSVQRHDVEMIGYEPTAARAILDLVDQVRPSADDVFYDLGAGFGHVAIMVHLLTGATVRGVEIEASYCRHAQRCVEELGLSRVCLVNRDARDVDFADGTVFFMYTPFSGKLLQTVLTALSRVARHRPLTLCTFGACSFEVARQPWLRLCHPEAVHAYALAVLTSSA
jgi:precorrin-6B methylase 2